MGKICGGSGLANRIKSCFGYVNYKASVRQINGDVRQAVELEWKARNINLK